METLLSVAGLLVGIVALVSLLPKMTIELGEPLNPRDAFSAPFVITNGSFYSVGDVEASLTVTRAAIGGGQFTNVGIGGMHQAVPKLARDDSFTLRSGIVTDVPVNEADITITVVYSVPFVPSYRWEKKSRFVFVRAAGAGFQWQRQPVE